MNLLRNFRSLSQAYLQPIPVLAVESIRSAQHSVLPHRLSESYNPSSDKCGILVVLTADCFFVNLQPWGGAGTMLLVGVSLFRFATASKDFRVWGFNRRRRIGTAPDPMRLQSQCERPTHINNEGPR